MARKTFISYKYSEAKDLRNNIIDALGKDAQYYQGETSESPDKTDTSTENIKRILKDMMYDSSVTIVIISPHMKESKWIDWEIEYSLKAISRDGRTSRTNGVVCVVMKVNGGYSWMLGSKTYADGHTSRTIEESYLYGIINKNRNNQVPKEYICDKCKTIDILNGSYISLITEEEFLGNPQKYIENSYDKSQGLDNYELNKTR